MRSNAICQINYITWGESATSFFVTFTLICRYCLSRLKCWYNFLILIFSSLLPGFKILNFMVDGIAFSLPWWTAEPSIIRFPLEGNVSHFNLSLYLTPNRKTLMKCALASRAWFFRARVGLGSGSGRARVGLGLHTLGSGLKNLLNT
jgi:hypothetical protein